MKIWNVKTTECTATLDEHTGKVSDINHYVKNQNMGIVDC